MQEPDPGPQGAGDVGKSNGIRLEDSVCPKRLGYSVGVENKEVKLSNIINNLFIIIKIILILLCYPRRPIVYNK